MRAIDRANKLAKKPKSIGFHSSEKHFKLNPNKKPEENIHSKDYKSLISKTPMKFSEMSKDRQYHTKSVEKASKEKALDKMKNK